jgi:hypothetical protein
MDSETYHSLKGRIRSAQNRLYAKLSRLDVSSLSLSDYNKRYLSKKIAGLQGVLQLYGRLILQAMSGNGSDSENFVMVDYGGGSGLISLLALEMGIGTVVYNDIYDVSCNDVGLLARRLNLEMDHIVCGDVDQLVSYLNRNSIAINAISSYDVLEHIYDVDRHFEILNGIKGGGFRIVYASGANAANPQITKAITKAQISAELEEAAPKWGHKERDSGQAYLQARKDIISACAPDLNSETVAALARQTRGLIRPEIEELVAVFRKDGRIDYQPDHPTNTCDPYTGNWCEHLMDVEWLEQVLEKAGFDATIQAGRYTMHGSLPRRIMKMALNAGISLLGRRGMFLAPYYLVCADLVRPGSRTHAARH